MKVIELKRDMDGQFRAMQSQVDAQFAETHAQMDARFAEMDAKMDARFDAVDGRFVEMERNIDARFLTQEASLRRLEVVTESMRDDTSLIATAVASMSTTLNRSLSERGTVVSTLDNHEVRLFALERHET